MIMIIGFSFPRSHETVLSTSQYLANETDQRVNKEADFVELVVQ